MNGVVVRKMLKSGELRRFGSFLAVGGLNTAFGYALFAGFILLGLGPASSLALATLGGVLFNYQSIGRLVFASRGNSLISFVLVYAVQFGVNLIGLQLLGRAGVPPLVAQALMLPFLAVGGFLAMRRFVFRSRAR